MTLYIYIGLIILFTIEWMVEYKKTALFLFLLTTIIFCVYVDYYSLSSNFLVDFHVDCLDNVGDVKFKRSAPRVVNTGCFNGHYGRNRGYVRHIGGSSYTMTSLDFMALSKHLASRESMARAYGKVSYLIDVPVQVNLRAINELHLEFFYKYLSKNEQLYFYTLQDVMEKMYRLGTLYPHEAENMFYSLVNGFHFLLDNCAVTDEAILHRMRERAATICVNYFEATKYSFRVGTKPCEFSPFLYTEFFPDNDTNPLYRIYYGMDQSIATYVTPVKKNAGVLTPFIEEWNKRPSIFAVPEVEQPPHEWRLAGERPRPHLIKMRYPVIEFFRNKWHSVLDYLRPPVIDVPKEPSIPEHPWATGHTRAAANPGKGLGYEHDPKNWSNFPPFLRQGEKWEDFLPKRSLMEKIKVIIDRYKATRSK